MKPRLIMLTLAAVAAANPGQARPGLTPDAAPVLIGLDAEFGHQSSTSAASIEKGMTLAIEEINSQGGVLGGRPLRLVTRDNRSVPARAIENVRELAAMPDMVAVFCGKFSPVVQELLPVVTELRLPLLDPWAAADDIIENGQTPNYAFRLSLTDRWAVEKLLDFAAAQGRRRLGLLVPNTGWGRSAHRAAERHAQSAGPARVVSTQWYNWGDKSLLPQYQALLGGGVDGLLLVANESEGALLVREMAGLPPAERRPVFSHWGITGGRFAAMAASHLSAVQLFVVQTYSFIDATTPTALKILAALKSRFGIDGPRQIDSPVGLAHAYDLTHILAKAIDLAGSTDRPKVRDALEKVPSYDGLIARYKPPFTASRHEALDPRLLFVGRYESDGAIVRADDR